MLKLVASACLVAVAFAQDYQSQFTQWMQDHQRAYTHDEFQYRFQTFKSNADFVANFDGEHQVALNEFADLSNEEFRRMYTGLQQNAVQDPSIELHESINAAPASIDWRNKGAVTHVKNQGQCGSCWSFSTTGSVEGQRKIETGTLVSFSEQNLVDCSVPEGNHGCDGGLMTQAFEYIIKNQGLDTEQSYPYQAEGPLQCRYKVANSGGYISSYKNIQSGSEPDLQNAIGTVGPISVAIDAGLSSFQFYHSGVYYAPDCSSTQLDHGVLAVGYSTTSGGTKYYIVKNSWGASWGLQGYIWMSRDRDNNCGIATMASYPQGAHAPSF